MEEFTIYLEVNKGGKLSEKGWKAIRGFIADKSVNKGVGMTILRNMWPEAEAPIIELPPNIHDRSCLGLLRLRDEYNKVKPVKKTDGSHKWAPPPSS
ncbi:ER glycerol-phosphate acyltransferase [Corchorus olitorius]|uniref:ER glycerol-phosphate acyltransferase n=1 Tax=Corchorus olitorius TaxID=93759 RepID=A0A1R3JYL7_9ROSI|nr:ER glycerol-phosphate acyltransferase [Corchorus olitorius]